MPQISLQCFPTHTEILLQNSQMATLKIHNLNWDSEVFNIRMGKMAIENLHITQIQKALTVDFASLNRHYDHLFAAVPSTHFVLTQFLEKLGFYLVDVVPVFVKTNSPAKTAPENFDFRFATSKDQNDIFRITDHTFSKTRFYNDKELLNHTQKDPNQIYQKWITNALNHPDKKILLIEKNQKTLGMILYSLQAKRAVIELIATDQNSTEKGIGTALLTQFENLLSDKGITEIEAGTNINNQKAISFYIKNGFLIEQTLFYFHYLFPIDTYRFDEIKNEYEESAKSDEEYAKLKWGSAEGMHNRFLLANTYLPWPQIHSWLDIGCGTGAFLRDIEANHNIQEFTGIDLSPSLIDYAQSKTYQTKQKDFLIQNFIEDFTEKKYDLVSAIGVLQKCGIPLEQAVKRLAHFTNPGGLVFITTKNKDWKAFQNPDFKPHPNHHWFSLDELKNAFTKAKLNIEILKGFDPRQQGHTCPPEDSHSVFIIARKDRS